jgi:hypothetical protein
VGVMENEVNEVMPKTTLELASAIVSFARSLSVDEELLQDALGVAKDAIWSDRMSAKRSPRG